MRRLLPSRRSAIHWIAVSAAVTVCAGGVALAASGRTPVIRACVSDSTGSVRIATVCRPGEHLLTWNQSGPPGPSGFPGPPGASGTPGPSGAPGADGPSHIWVDGASSVQLTLSYTLPTTNTSASELATTGPLDSGYYAATAYVEVSASEPFAVPDHVSCQLEVGQFVHDGSNADSVTMTVNPGENTIVLMAAAFIGRGNDISTSCYQTSGIGAVDVVDVQQTTTLTGAVD